MVFTFLWIFDLAKKKGIYLPEMSTRVLILLVSPTWLPRVGEAESNPRPDAAP